MKINITTPYDVKRRREYPPIGDQLDIIIKAFKTPGKVPQEMTDLIAKVDAVKAKYPKP